VNNQILLLAGLGLIGAAIFMSRKANASESAQFTTSQPIVIPSGGGGYTMPEIPMQNASQTAIASDPLPLAPSVNLPQLSPASNPEMQASQSPVPTVNIAPEPMVRVPIEQEIKHGFVPVRESAKPNYSDPVAYSTARLKMLAFYGDLDAKKEMENRSTDTSFLYDRAGRYSGSRQADTNYNTDLSPYKQSNQTRLEQRPLSELKVLAQYGDRQAKTLVMEKLKQLAAQGDKGAIYLTDTTPWDY
jgi:hypothetical protein